MGEFALSYEPRIIRKTHDMVVVGFRCLIDSEFLDRFFYRLNRSVTGWLEANPRCRAVCETPTILKISSLDDRRAPTSVVFPDTDNGNFISKTMSRSDCPRSCSR